MNNLIEECKNRSMELLKANSRKEGILASSVSKKADERNYVSVFARDAGICSLGMVLTGGKELFASVKASLLILAKHQADNGQIPNFVRTEPFRVDFWKIDCIDSTLWWLISLKVYDKYSGVKLSIKLKKSIEKALNWLNCREHQEDWLLTQNEASDWADIMPRSGKVLYSNALWYKVKTLYGLDNAEETRKYFNIIFDPSKAKLAEVPRCQLSTYKLAVKKKRKAYLSFVNYYFWGNDVDVFGHSLSLLFGLPDKAKKDELLSYIAKKQNKKYPMPVLFDPIKKEDRLWRPYMDNKRQNKPYQYHNGGIWPFASCFWATALAASGRRKEALAELERIAEFNKINNWQFNEWFHVKTGKPMGMHGQSWNAGGFLMAYFFLEENIGF